MTDTPVANLKPSHRWKRPVLAGLLSLLFPGMGQLYNRQPRKAFFIAIINHVFRAFETHTRLLLSFPGMVATILFLLAWQIFVAADAARNGVTFKPENPIALPKLTYPLLAIIILLGAFLPTPAHLSHESGFAAFKIPSQSMCPTICAGDRLVADSWAYRERSPQRGDLILFKHGSSGVLFTKRVIALPGDLVAPGPSGELLVNGQPFRPPVPCGGFTDPKPSGGESPDFCPIRVDDRTLFVVGDNLANSLDSRFPDFGPVTADSVRGRPLFLYWSLMRSRIGCQLH